jgi:mycothiol synthase
MSDSPRSVPDWVSALAARARTADGAPPFSDQAIVDYRTGARELVAIDETAAALVADAAAPAEALEAEFVVDPDARGRGVGTRLLEQLLTRSHSRLLVWAHADSPAARALAASHGLIPARTLLHLHRELFEVVLPEPREGPLRTTRGWETFVVGRDEEEWVALNALIFAEHAEQGSVTVHDLLQLESEEWFSPDDFVVLREPDGRMIGYCWLKVEGIGAKRSGEIYVVGLHPEFRGRGMGGALFEAGLDRLREQGIRRVHLYVEADNAPALKLYYSRGFERESVDIQYRSTTPS